MDTKFQVKIPVKDLHCYSCDQSFPTIHQFKSHHQEQHPEKNLYTSTPCSTTLQFPVEIKSEEIISPLKCLENEDIINVSCHVCSSHFISLQLFLDHLHGDFTSTSPLPNNSDFQEQGQYLENNNEQSYLADEPSSPIELDTFNCDSSNEKEEVEENNAVHEPPPSRPSRSRRKRKLLPPPSPSPSFLDKSDDDDDDNISIVNDQDDEEYQIETSGNDQSEDEDNDNSSDSDFCISTPKSASKSRGTYKTRTKSKPTPQARNIKKRPRMTMKLHSESGSESESDPKIPGSGAEAEVEPEEGKEKPEKKLVKVTCGICNRPYKNRYVLRKHFERIHSAHKEEHTCPACSFPFKSTNELTRHMKRFTFPEPKICPILTCSQSFDTKCAWKIHKRTHPRLHRDRRKNVKKEPNDNAGEELLAPRIPKEKKPFPCTHTGCDKVMRSKKNLQRHLKLHDRDPSVIHECADCNKTFTSKHYLKGHRSLVHERSLCSFLCTECGKQFNSAGKLEIHSRSHSGEKPFLCISCPFQSSTLSSLKRHSFIHSTEKMFPCTWPGCDKSFSMRQVLQRHLQIHSGLKPYKCRVCGLGFGDNRSLKKHIFSAHPDFEFDPDKPATYQNYVKDPGEPAQQIKVPESDTIQLLTTIQEDSKF